MTDYKQLMNFDLKLYPYHQVTSQYAGSFTGTGDQWKQYQTIKQPGFNGSQVIDLTNFWRIVIEHQPSHYQCDVIGLETIVKWSSTRQLKERFTLVAQMTYK
ncbi:hypothetical protein [Solemya velum gill symbiont]|nr:hypothetical protein [Solemya velum gill symbiont]OOY35762.1 hypothetical protein BOV88_03755 [Solemya velum gill symbiont]OOY38390.1 hypothetical protein BOV89_03020 [Solemya velum gill symbiont]OOY51952.1 hypothetical protein BOV94_04055 [Solemya velum gill symbiont]OOY66823.1 hypothetical protein BOW05_01440 [Solemya velum gill symbiont]OOY73780.1 hypothetical protein BOW08_00010 [Solemya velum gill symbiont]